MIKLGTVSQFIFSDKFEPQKKKLKIKNNILARSYDVRLK